jgi:5-methyltetrahydropteroyltriglutamate--homocysteine methyltransferase
VKQSDDRILTTHAGSLARPDDLVRMMWDWLDGNEQDEAKVKARVAEATAEIARSRPRSVSTSSATAR